MKKLVISLLGAAILATASTAMAIPTLDTYTVYVGTGLGPAFAGVAYFDFDSENINIVGPTPVGGFPGSCVYSLQWFSEAGVPTGPGGTLVQPLALSSQAWVAEQMSHGYGSCLINAVTAVPSVVTLAPPPYPPSTGFTQFGQINDIFSLQVGETDFPKATLSGLIQYAIGANVGGSIFAIQFAAN